MTTPEPVKTLSRKHRAFVSEWLKCFNGTLAYMRVYPKSTREAARTSAASLLTIPNIAAAIEAGLNELHMSAEEALKLQADIARGDMAEVMPGGVFDMDEAKRSGLSKLIKKVKTRRNLTGEDIVEITEVELYDAQAAIRDVLKVHGRFAPVKVDLTSKGEKIKGYVGVQPDDWDDQPSE